MPYARTHTAKPPRVPCAVLIEYSHTTEHAYHMHMLINVAQSRGIAVVIVGYFHPVMASEWLKCIGRSGACNVSQLAVTPTPPRFMSLFADLGVTVVSSHRLHAKPGLASLQRLKAMVTTDGRHATRAAHEQLAQLVAHALVDGTASRGSCAGHPQPLRTPVRHGSGGEDGGGKDGGGEDGGGKDGGEQGSFCARGEELAMHVLPSSVGWNYGTDVGMRTQAHMSARAAPPPTCMHMP